MYLWQIRHIPNHRKTFFNLTALSLALAAGVWFSEWLFLPVAAQSKDEADPPVAVSAEKAKTQEVADGGASVVQDKVAATEFVAGVHRSLKEHTSVKANIDHVTAVGTERLHATGKYLTSGSKLRLEFDVDPERGTGGTLLEVCDGRELWTLTTLPNKKKRVTHRDVQVIKNAMAQSKNIPDATVAADLGLGGLTALFASLERTMTFETIKQEQVEGRTRTSVQGRWKDEVQARWPQGKDGITPPYIPDLVRIAVDGRTNFPERITYLKKFVPPAASKENDPKAGNDLFKGTSKKTYRALVDMKFSDVEINVTVDDQEFSFVPPKDEVPEDVTRMFLDRLTKPSEEKESSAKAGAKANGK